MKKIFTMLLFAPLFSFAQQDLLKYYNCFNAAPNDYIQAQNAFFDSQNQPIIFSNNGSGDEIHYLQSGVWNTYTCPYGAILDPVMDNNYVLWFQTDNGVITFNGSIFTLINASITSTWQSWGLVFDKITNKVWHVNDDGSGGFTFTDLSTGASNFISIVLTDFRPLLFAARNNKIYCLSHFYLSSMAEMVEYNTISNTFIEITLPQPLTGMDSYGYVNLDLNGDIYYLVDETTDGQGVWCYKINHVNLLGDTIFNYVNANILASDYQLGHFFFDDSNTLWWNASDDVISFSNNTVTDYNIYSFFNGTYNQIGKTLGIDNNGHLWANGFLSEGTPDVYYGVLEFSKNGFKNIPGKVYNDQNSNGIFDSGETPLPNQIVYHNQNSYANSDDSGVYYLKFIDSSLTYNVQPIIPNYWQCQTNCSYAVTPSVQLNSNYDFGLEPTGIFNDLNVTVTATPERPGFGSTKNILIKNVGTTSNTPTLTYAYDAQENFSGAIPTPSSVTGNTLTWNLNSLAPFQQQNIQLWFSLPSSVAIGTPLASIATVTGTGTENTPADNVDSLNQAVVGSFDPNEKTVTPSGNINSGDWLTYTVYFQNTGIDTAFNVTVLDTLDSNLDFSTLDITGFSHPLTWQIKGAGYLKFSFNTILLPDSNTNEALSHGYVSYRIKSKSGLSNGTLIHNTASIYFDFNSSVVTNTTSTLIGPLSTICNCEKSFSIFPTLISSGTPIQIRDAQTGDDLKLIDCVGRILKQEKIISSTVTLDTKNLSSGIYFIQCGSAVRKLVVE